MNKEIKELKKEYAENYTTKDRSYVNEINVIDLDKRVSILESEVTPENLTFGDNSLVSTQATKAELVISEKDLELESKVNNHTTDITTLGLSIASQQLSINTINTNINTIDSNIQSINNRDDRQDSDLLRHESSINTNTANIVVLADKTFTTYGRYITNIGILAQGVNTSINLNVDRAPDSRYVTYTSPDKIKFLQDGFASLQISGRITNTSAVKKLIIITYKNDVELYRESIDLIVGENTLTRSFATNLIKNDVIRFEYNLAAGSGTASNAETFHFDIEFDSGSVNTIGSDKVIDTSGTKPNAGINSKLLKISDLDENKADKTYVDTKTKFKSGEVLSEVNYPSGGLSTYEIFKYSSSQASTKVISVADGVIKDYAYFDICSISKGYGRINPLFFENIGDKISLSIGTSVFSAIYTDETTLTFDKDLI